MNELKILKKINVIQRTIFLFLIFCSYAGYAQHMSAAVEKDRDLRIMFYNCENFFDTNDDSLTLDNEFLPEGEKYWTKSKYYDKQEKLVKVITAIGGWSPPELVGLCEIENQFVLKNLLFNSALYQSEYSFIHQESPDRRGIDVALLYQPKKFHPIETSFIEITFSNSNSKTRDILYCKGATKNKDTLHIFVNHWPSRWGGQLETEHKRIQVATILKKKVDSIFNSDSLANIIIMGDLNDYPKNKSITTILDAKTRMENSSSASLYNLTAIKYLNQQIGSHKHEGNWGILDHIIVSGNIIANYTTVRDVYIYNASFLLEIDEKYLGQKPYRTYLGYKFHGGFSDHLPIFFDLNY